MDRQSRQGVAGAGDSVAREAVRVAGGASLGGVDGRRLATGDVSERRVSRTVYRDRRRASGAAGVVYASAARGLMASREAMVGANGDSGETWGRWWCWRRPPLSPSLLARPVCWPVSPSAAQMGWGCGASWVAFNSRFFIKRPPERAEPLASSSSVSWEPVATTARLQE